MRDRARFRLARIRYRLSGALRNQLGLRRTTYVQARVDEYRGYWKDGAERLGATFTPLTRDVWEIRSGDRVLRLSNHIAPCDDHATRILAGDKPYCYALATAHGVRVPEHVVFETSDLGTARRFVERQAPPFVVKPARDTASGLGISTGLESWSEVVRAAALASLHGRTLLLERMVAGESCRLLYLGGRMIHAVRRRGVRVTGDGTRTIEALLVAAGHGALGRDHNTLFTLAASGQSLSTVPGPGEERLVRSLPAGIAERRELRTVYGEDVTGLCAPSLCDELARVVTALGSEFAGIDIITNDLGRSLAESNGTFLEINTTPGIHHHYLAPQTAEPVAKLVLAYLFRGARNGRS